MGAMCAISIKTGQIWTPRGGGSISRQKWPELFWTFVILSGVISAIALLGAFFSLGG
jgi:hypothetical protein